MRPRIECSVGDDAMEDYGFLKYTDDTMRASFLQALHTMRKNRLFCDVVLNVENTDIHAHKNVLACVSPHLMELFSAEESSQYHHSDGIPSYRLNGGLTRVALQALVDYAYTGRLELPDVFVQEVYMAAWQLRIDAVVRECARHLIDDLCADTCIETRSLPGINKNKLFVGAVDAFVGREFAAVAKTAAFLQLPCANIDVLYQTKQEMALVTNVSLCRLVLDWTRRQLTDESLKMVHLLERTHLLYLALDNSLQDCSDLPPGHESESDLVQDYKRLVLKSATTRGGGRKKALAAPHRPRVIIYSREISEQDASNVQPDWSVIASSHVGENTFVALVTLNGQPTRISIQLRLNQPPPSASPVHTPDAALAAALLHGLQLQAAGGTAAAGSSSSGSNSCASSVHSSDDHRSDEEDAAGAAAAAAQDAGLAAGGLAHTNAGQPEMFCEVAPMSGPKCGLGAVAWTSSEGEQRLLVCGGYDRGECLKVVESYDPARNRWQTERSMLEARGRVQMAVLAGAVYAVGGSNGSTELDTMECLRPGEGQKWQKRCRLPLARSNAGVCTIGDRLYCIGGWNGQTGIRLCDVYGADADRWSPVAPLQVGRSQAGVAAYGGCLWVAGGSDAWNCLSAVERYDPSDDRWTSAASLLTPRRGCGLAAFGGRLYAVGGSDGTHSLASTEVYDEQTQTWTVGPSLTTPRANVAVLCVGDRLYAVGGFAGKIFLNTVEYLDATTNEWTTFVPQAGSVRVQEVNGEVVVAALTNGAQVDVVGRAPDADRRQRNERDAALPAAAGAVSVALDDADVFFSDSEEPTTTTTATTDNGQRAPAAEKSSPVANGQRTPRSNSVRRKSSLSTIAELVGRKENGGSSAAS